MMREGSAFIQMSFECIVLIWGLWHCLECNCLWHAGQTPGIIVWSATSYNFWFAFGVYGGNLEQWHFGPEHCSVCFTAILAITANMLFQQDSVCIYIACIAWYALQDIWKNFLAGMTTTLVPSWTQCLTCLISSFTTLAVLLR